MRYAIRRLLFSTSILSLALQLIVLNAFGQFTKLHDFDIVPDGRNPHGSFVTAGTMFYGMTYQGGVNNLGTIFEIKPDGTGYAKIMEFAGSTNGSHPWGSLFFDGSFLYGMTEDGGVNNLGVIFKVKSDGTGFVKLFDFINAENGYSPRGSLIFDGTFLYGVTSNGGTNSAGVIFKIKPDGTGFTKVLDFAGGTNGSVPVGDLIFDGTFLYGMTYMGGTSNLGTIFKIKSDGTGFSKLLDFVNTNGYYPKGSLISDGNFLYGMTYGGGTYGFGTVFKISPDGTGYNKMLDFAGVSNGGDGRNPEGSLNSDGAFLYGMTNYGGTNDTGTIFRINPNGTGYVKLLDLTFATNGVHPWGSLISDGTFLYGMTEDGGAKGVGTIFKYAPEVTVSIEELTEGKRASIKTFPNPVHEELFIQVPSQSTLTMFDAMGREVKSSALLMEQTNRIETHDLSTGNYILWIKSSSTIDYLKISKVE
ncbi:MAG: choice-of-anchor tandem repeat GloVer-containing protein [Chryseolinea sp.]